MSTVTPATTTATMSTTTTTVRRLGLAAIFLVLLGSGLLMMQAVAGAAPAGAGPSASWHATPVPTPTATAKLGDRAGPPAPPAPPVTRSPTITENDPRWDCRLMGNRRCGIHVPACQVRGYTVVTERACTALWMRPQRTVVGDGYESIVPDGRSLVRECQQDNRTDARALACFLAWLSGS